MALCFQTNHLPILEAREQWHGRQTLFVPLADNDGIADDYLIIKFRVQSRTHMDCANVTTVQYVYCLVVSDM